MHDCNALCNGEIHAKLVYSARPHDYPLTLATLNKIRANLASWSIDVLTFEPAHEAPIGCPPDRNWRAIHRGFTKPTGDMIERCRWPWLMRYRQVGAGHD